MRLNSTKSMKQNILQKTTIISFVITMSVAYPFLFHLFGINGKVFLPIFLFVVLGANYLDFKTIFSIAIFVPLLNFLFTGMPIIAPYPILQLLTLELAMFVIFLQVFKKTIGLNFISRVISFLFARISSLVLILFYSKLTFSFWFANFRIGIVGILINLLIVELIIKMFAYERN